MGRKTTIKRIVMILTIIALTVCNCLTIPIYADNYTSKSTEIKTEFKSHQIVRSSSFVDSVDYFANNAYYECEADFYQICSGTMKITIKKKDIYGNWNKLDSYQTSFTNASDCTATKIKNLYTGTYKIYVEITSQYGTYSSSSPEFNLA